MNMINLNIQLDDFSALLLAKGPYTIFNQCTQFATQNPIAILGHPDNVVLTMPQRL
jgi:hypothetical protein